MRKQREKILSGPTGIKGAVEDEGGEGVQY